MLDKLAFHAGCQEKSRETLPSELVFVADCGICYRGRATATAIGLVLHIHDKRFVGAATQRFSTVRGRLAHLVVHIVLWIYLGAQTRKLVQ